MTKTTFHFNVPAETIEKERWFVASCYILDVHSQGKTIDQAKENLKEALTLFFISCYEMGTLEEVLKESGFKPASLSTEDETAQSYDFIDVPLPFVISDNKLNNHKCLV